MVIDASITIAWLFEDESDDAAKEIARTVGRQGAVVPSIWRLEVANVLRSGERRGRCTHDFVDQSLARLAEMAISVDAETDGRAWGDTFALARSDVLTEYDAAYLELAKRLKLPLATRDAELIAAAARHDVQVIGN